MNALRTLLCGLLLSPMLALGQTIVAGEYFVDTDPGIGNGVAFPTVPGDSTSTTLTINPGLLPSGFHALGIRHRDTNGRWSHALARRFYVHDVAFANPPTAGISMAEYFLDTDPGPGNGTAFPISAGDSTFTTLVVPAGVLTPGFHTLSIRQRNASGSWSHALTQRFFIHDVSFTNPPSAPVLGGEYYFDTDPGPGNGTAFTVNSGDSTNTTLVADVSALAPGFHVMGIRQHDANGNWSHALAQRFYVHEVAYTNPSSAPIVGGEYFFDTDPGIGNGTAFTASPADSVNLAFPVDASALANGFHTFGLRFRDMNGHWSQAPSRPVFIQDSVFIGSEAAPIVAAEYYFDTDPGLGNGTVLPTGAPADSIDITAGLPVGSLLNGPHTVTMRVKDADGNWSQPETRPFTVVDGGGAYRTIASGNWNDPAIWERYDGGNWVTSITTPSFLDSLITVRVGDTVTVNTAVTVDQVVVESGAALVNTAYLLVADGPGTDLDVQGTFTHTVGGSLAGSGLVLVNGQYFWTGGSVLAGLTIQITASATAQVNYAGTLVHTGIINNHGTWTHITGNLHGAGVFNNLATGTLLWNGAQDPNNSWQTAINNQGILHVNVTGYVTHSGNGFVNMTGGSVVVLAGELRVNGFTNASIIECQGSSLFRIIGGTFTNNAGGDVSLARIILAGGTVVVNATFDIVYFIFESGTINGPLAVNILTGGTFGWNGGTIGATAIVNVNVGVNVTVNTAGTVYAYGTINNNGTWAHVGGNLAGTGVFNVGLTGVVNITGTGSWQPSVYNLGGFNQLCACTFTHSGFFSNLGGGSVNVSAGQFWTTGGFTNAGLITTSLTSYFSVQGGTFTNNTGGDATGAQVVIAGGNVIVNAIFNVTYIHVSGGTINGPLAVNILNGGTMLWTGGTIGATAIVNVNVGVNVTVNPAGTVYAYGTINNSGTWVHAGGNLWGTGVFNNLLAGTVNVTGVLSPTNGWQNAVWNQGTVSVNVSGVFGFTGTVFTNQTGGIVTVLNGELQVNGFVNSGTITCTATTVLRITGGTFTNDTGGDASAGTIILSAGTMVLNVQLNILHFTIEGGTVNGPMAVNILNGGTFDWTGGTIASTAVINVNVNVVVTFNPIATAYCHGIVNNQGTWNFDGGDLQGNGTFNNLVGAVVNINAVLDVDLSWQLVFYNAGIVNKVVPGLFTHYGTVFHNLSGGAVNVVAGEYRFKGGFINAGVITSTGAAFLCHHSGTFTNNAGGDASNGRVVIFGGGLVVNAVFNIQHFRIEGGTVYGPLAINVVNGGTLGWSGGIVDATSVINVNVNVVVTFNPIATVYCHGIINHSGTWNFDGGDLQGTGTFNNLVGGIVNINAVLDVDLSWQLVFYNAGIVNKVVPGLFTHYGTVFHNLTGGAVNVLAGEYRFKGGFINAGVITSTGAAFLCHHSGTFTNNAGGDASNGRVVIFGGGLVVNAVFNIQHFRIEGGTVYGPLAVNVINGGTFGWSGGVIDVTSVIDIDINVVSTFSPTVAVFCHGTINNGGTWNFTGGDLHGGGTFNNLVTGVINISGVLTSGSSWLVVLYNAGIYNYNYNGTFTHLTGSFDQVAGAALNVLQGTLVLDGVFLGPRYGTITVALGAFLNVTTTVSFLGTLVTNDGTITCPDFHIMGSAVQTLGGNGSFTHLRFDNAGGVVLQGNISVTILLTLVNGHVDLGAYDLTLLNPALNALVGGSITSYFTCTGIGSFKRVVNGVDYPFPIGTAVHYLPVTYSLTAGLQETFSARVQLGVSSEYGAPGIASGTTITNDVVGCTWVLGEGTPGGNTASVLVHWTAALEGIGFDRTDCAVAYYGGADWTLGTLGAAGGITLYTRLITNITVFREIIVADGDVDLNPIAGVLVQARMLLQGPLDAGTGLMGDALRSLGYLPLTEPYTAIGYTYTGSVGGSMNASVLATTGPDAIVDWVIIEARSSGDNSLVLFSRSALLQRDGDVVAVDGSSSVMLDLPAGSYQIAVRHRNHLGCMTATPVSLGAAPTVVDLRLASTATFGTDARKPMGSYMALWAGDVNGDEGILYTGASNDRDPILSRIGGALPTATATGYHAEDVNLDGTVKYSGEGNDRDPILQNIGGVVPTATREGTLP
jgi:hypothetical protein